MLISSASSTGIVPFSNEGSSVSSSQGSSLFTGGNNNRVGREDFSSKGTLSYISLGNYKNKTCNASPGFKDSFLIHQDNNYYEKHKNNSEYNSNSGLQDTKFGIGFTRKSDIINPEKDARDSYKQISLQNGAILNNNRRNNLKKVDEKSGYNIITGALKGSGPIVKNEGKKFVSKELALETIRNGQIQLRDSMLKFYTPQSSGIKCHYRQSILLNEGLHDNRYSAILQSGKKDIPSYGIEDNFSKNQYQKNNERTSNGLYECRIPGKYTPRKDIRNPSGNQRIVDRWTTDIMLKSYNP